MKSEPQVTSTSRNTLRVESWTVILRWGMEWCIPGSGNVVCCSMYQNSSPSGSFPWKVVALFWKVQPFLAIASMYMMNWYKFHGEESQNRGDSRKKGRADCAVLSEGCIKGWNYWLGSRKGTVKSKKSLPKWYDCRMLVAPATTPVPVRRSASVSEEAQIIETFETILDLGLPLPKLKWKD